MTSLYILYKRKKSRKFFITVIVINVPRWHYYIIVSIKLPITPATVITYSSSKIKQVSASNFQHISSVSKFWRSSYSTGAPSISFTTDVNYSLHPDKDVYEHNLGLDVYLEFNEVSLLILIVFRLENYELDFCCKIIWSEQWAN